MTQTNKPTVTLICYADMNMSTSQKLCIKSALEKGAIDYAQDFSPDFIESDAEFVDRNKDTWYGQQRGGGFGFWLWKPYICEFTTRNASEGTYVVYADAGVEFLGSVQPIIEYMEKTEQEIFLFGNQHTHAMWCKKKVLESMLPNWHQIPGFESEEQVQASVIIFKVSKFTRLFMRQWLAWSEIPGFIDDSDNVGLTEHFRDGRNDQAILTNLAINWGIPRHWWPVQYGHVVRSRYPADQFYGQIFYHHRWREEDWISNNMTIEQFQKQPKNI
jgi:Cft2 family RNA processing exonuclease